ncbi:MAG: hypothetical protein DMENIID0002_12560 [Rickettsia endosymbiont of Sergentomyia squamirostris]|uniref:Uncharacterized protein n=1 Tax=Candidatus Tisiphia endosymbiont of Sergentomyia squamirostris TaxID=3113639 RepID=A0AAT9G9T2_9RICK
MVREIIDNIVNKIIASLTFNDPFAKGLFFVRKTCLSKSLSKISLRTLPAPLVTILPIKNNNNNFSKLYIVILVRRTPKQAEKNTNR